MVNWQAFPRLGQRENGCKPIILDSFGELWFPVDIYSLEMLKPILGSKRLVVVKVSKE